MDSLNIKPSKMRYSGLITFCLLAVLVNCQTMVMPYESCADCSTSRIVPDNINTTYSYVSGNLDESDIEGDFSRRICCANKWHKGIDISPEQNNGDLSDGLLAFEGGTIVAIENRIYLNPRVAKRTAEPKIRT